jgi:transcriptional regulator with XRE-family HTH domain
MIAGSVASMIPAHVLWDDYYDNLHYSYNSLREAFVDSAMTQDQLASLLGISKSRVSKVFSGKENLTIKTLSYFGTAMRRRLITTYVPYEQIGYSNVFSPTVHKVFRIDAQERAGTPFALPYNIDRLVTGTPTP